MSKAVPHIRPVERPDPFQDEIAAMRAVAHALDGLSPEARVRVTLWARDACQVPELTVPSISAAPVEPAPPPDAGLSLAGLEDLFPCPPPEDETLRLLDGAAKSAPDVDPARQPETGLSMAGIEDMFPAPPSDDGKLRILDFAARAARAGELVDAPEVGLSMAGIDDLFERRLPTGDDGAIMEPAANASLSAVEDAADTHVTQRPALETQPVVTMLHGFVEDFQRLARDWEGV
jgi:hypothetical protein